MTRVTNPSGRQRAATMSPLVREALLSLMHTRKIASQTEFARAVKLSTGYVCDVLALRRNLSPLIIQRVIKAYGLNRKQAGDLHYRAARVAGFEVPPPAVDQRVVLAMPPPGQLMRDKPTRRRAYVTKPVVVVGARIGAKTRRRDKSGVAVKVARGVMVPAPRAVPEPTSPRKRKPAGAKSGKPDKPDKPRPEGQVQAAFAFAKPPLEALLRDGDLDRPDSMPVEPEPASNDA